MFLNNFYKKNVLFCCISVIGILISACGKSENVSAPTLSATQNTMPVELKRIDVKVGDGKSALKGSNVAVHYSGWLYDDSAKNKKGNLFDTSSDLGEPLVFVLGEKMVIKGWDEGIVGMKVGGKRTLMIPSEMAYGSKRLGTARTAIPANSALVFDVELMNVE